MVPNPPPSPNPVLRRGWQVADPALVDHQEPESTGAGKGAEGGPLVGRATLGVHQEGV